MNSNQTRRSNNVDWFDQTPDSWGVGKLYQYCRLTSGSTPSRKIDEYWENGTIPWMSSGEVNKKLIDHIHVKISESGFKNSSVEILPVGTVMMALNGQGKTKGTVGLLRVESTCNQSLCGMIPHEKLSSEFLYFYLESQYRTLRGLVGEGQREGISVSFLSRYPVVIPPLEEQKLISRYLDKKTQQIDSLIEKIQKKIELLKEQRTSLINQCVTKGLDPNVEMKDSGVEWIGEIPKHWDSLPIRYVTEDHRQGFYTSDPYDDEGVPILRITDIQEDHSFSYWDSPKYSRSEEEIGKFYVNKEDFLFPRTGGVGRFGIVDFDFPCIYGSFMIRFRWDSSIDRTYMKFFLESSLFTDQVKQEIHGGVNQNVHVENIKDVTFFRPPLEEQSVISKYLQKNCVSLDKEVNLEKERISLLREYRQSLISSVVTDKVRVTEDMI